MSRQVEIDQQVELVSDVGSRGAARVDTFQAAGRAKKRRAGLREMEIVILQKEIDPVGRIGHELHVQVLNVLSSDQIQVTQIIMTEWEELIERAESGSLTRLSIARGKIVVEPNLW